MLRPFLPLLLLAGAFPPHAAVSGEQTEHRFSAELKKPVGYSYLRWLPAGYDSPADRRWPLLLFLHGAGERGTDVRLVAKHGPPKLLAGVGLTPGETAAARELGEKFIVISPQCPPEQVWDDDAVLALLDRASTELRVDRTRVYLAGLSMGGYGTWSIGLRNPGRFAAIVPICGGGRTIDLLLSRSSRKAELLALGIWAFHGAQDQTVVLDESERMIRALRKAGATGVQLTVYPEAKHDSWTETFANPELYAWLLRHQRAPAP